MRRRMLSWSCMVLIACASTSPSGNTGTASGDDLLVVDCLLPGQIRQLGGRATYVTARRAVKLPAGECEIRGGEYTAYDRASLATSLRIWLPKAKQGDPEAQTYVGEMFEKGLGVPADHAGAALWYRRAAEQGYSRAQINLGSLYEKGLGVDRDPKQAVEWYRRASGMSEPLFRIEPPSATNSGEVAQLRAELVEVRQQLSGRERELVQIRSQMEGLQEKLRSGAGDLEREQSELQRLRTQLVAQQSANSAHDAIEQRIRESEQRLVAKQQELGRVEQSLAKLEEESERRLALVGQLKQQQQQQAPIAPTIEIIEPEILATRGTRGIRLEPAASELMLVGRINAPAGLLTLTVNGEEPEVESNGLFRTRIQLDSSLERIRVVAIDREGRKTVDELSLPGRDVSTFASSDSTPAADRLGIPLPSSGGLKFGRYHALVIGNNDYQSLPRLETAVADAEAVGRILDQKYDFEVTLLIDGTRYQLLSALNRLRKELTEEDNLLVYYAGHGDLDRVNQRGHWLPIDAERESTANWVSNISITDILNTMSVKQLLVIADSCYSGTLTRSAVAQLEAGRSGRQRLELVRALLGQKSRMVLTSGGLEPVLDSVGGEHSDFAAAFLEALELNQGILMGRELHEAILPRVVTTADQIDFHQVPEYAPIKYAGHESGDFFLVRASR